MRLLKLTGDGKVEIMPPRAHFAGPPKPEGIPRRLWEKIFSPKSSPGLRLTGALAAIRLLTMGRGPAWMQFHTLVDVAGLKAARSEIDDWAGWNHAGGGPIEGNPQLRAGVEDADEVAEAVGVDEGVMLQFSQAAKAAGYGGILEWLISCGISENERRK